MKCFSILVRALSASLPPTPTVGTTWAAPSKQGGRLGKHDQLEAGVACAFAASTRRVSTAQHSTTVQQYSKHLPDVDAET